MNIENILTQAFKELSNSNIKNANLDCEVLLSNIINKDREYVILNSKKNLDKKYIDIFNNLIDRRKKSEPIAYLINKKEFWKETFYIDKNVLIPRPDTEHIIEEIIRFTQKDSKLHILDIGTGSGCIILSILKERENFKGTGMFSVKYQFALNELYRLGTDMKNWVFAQQHLRTIDDLFGGKPQFRFNQHLDRLYLDIDWDQDVDIDDLVIIRAHEVLDVTSFTDGYNDEFLKKYLVSLFKKQWGQNLMKFEGIQMPGGVTLNGRQLYDDAREELTQLNEELYTRYSGPDQFIVG